MSAWDGEAFRRRMLMAEERAEGYAREHADRLRRGQSNGSESMRATSLGEAFAYGSLASHISTDRPEALVARLTDMLANPPPARPLIDEESWQRGYLSIVRSLLAEIKGRDQR